MATTIGPAAGTANLYQAQTNRDASAERIASGVQINSAADNAAGLVIVNRSTSAIIEFQQGIRNASDGIALLQTADGSLGSIDENLQRFRELALQASNGTLSDSDRAALNAEALQLRDEINRIISSTSFNGQPVLTREGSINIQSGSDSGDAIQIRTRDVQQQLADLSFDKIDLGSSSGAQEALGILDSARDLVNQTSSGFGASVNRLQSTINNLQNSRTDAEATRSRINDTDYARETSEQARNDVLLQAGLAIQAQANIRSELVLRLLSG